MIQRIQRSDKSLTLSLSITVWDQNRRQSQKNRYEIHISLLKFIDILCYKSMLWLAFRPSLRSPCQGDCTLSPQKFKTSAFPIQTLSMCSTPTVLAELQVVSAGWGFTELCNTRKAAGVSWKISLTKTLSPASRISTTTWTFVSSRSVAD